MKTAGIIVVVFTVIWGAINIIWTVQANYRYETFYSSYWDLADKSSTIEEKSKYIDKFVSALEKSKLQGKYNAEIFPTPDNSFDKNLDALKSLQLRLKEIKKMNVSSFEYQTAIQQITAQEQGEAKDMLEVLKGVWIKEYFPTIWNWFGAINVILTLCVFSFGVILILADD